MYIYLRMYVRMMANPLFEERKETEREFISAQYETKNIFGKSSAKQNAMKSFYTPPKDTIL